MDSRSSLKTISVVSDQLKIFTLAELFYILQQDARISLFDIHRIKRITDAVRYRFNSSHTNEEIARVIQLLSNSFKQTLPVENEMSFSYILNRQFYDPVIMPFSSVCYVCQRSLGALETKQRSIKIYCVNGSVISGKLMSLVCNHADSIHHCDSSLVTIYPNFIYQDDKHVYSYDSLHYGLYIYVGGDVALERALVDKFTAEFIHQGLSIHSFINALNQEAHNNYHLQLRELEPHIVSSVLFRYLYIQMYISMGKAIVYTPARIIDYDAWAWKEFPQVLRCFTYLWMNHETIIGRCNDSCSQCLVVDGHQKCRRRICGFKDVTVDTEEMSQIVIGCCRTPVSNSRYCSLHASSIADVVVGLETTNTSIKKSLKRLTISKKKRKNDKVDKLNATSCQTAKERSDSYVQQCSRSFGLIALIYNCKIIAGFSELFRSETLKEIINLFCSCIRVSGRLAPTLVYDDGCHLVAYIRNHIERDLVRTNALHLLASTPVSVERMHFKNHVGKFCRLEMNPDNNRLLDNINTEAAEQCFSWLKKYAFIISSMNWLRTPIFLIVLFYYKNLSYVQRRPTDVFDVYNLVPNVVNMSLCHAADTIVASKKRNIQAVATRTINNHPIAEPFDLPPSTTDWQNKVRLLNIK